MSDQIADYVLLGAALSHQCDDSQITMFWLCREGRAALQARAMERWNPVMLGSGIPTMANVFAMAASGRWRANAGCTREHRRPPTRLPNQG
ncbi:MAG: hypothetical protein ACYCPF_19480, partial [Streptosporangiaceae bacterium]